MKRSSRGFTLPELMVVLAVAAAILTIGVPNFKEFQRNNRLTVAANDALGLVITSRAEALRRGNTVSMCTTADSSPDDATCASGSGWIVFEDKNGDCVRDKDEEKITGLRIDDDVNAASNSNCLSFASSGYKRLVGGQPTTVHMLYCDNRKNNPRTPGSTDSAARGIEVTPTGRGAVVKLVSEIESWDSGDDKVSCP